MGSLLIEIGQCGCQIGLKINENLSNSYYSTRIKQPNRLHTIMIDTQPKVLKPIIQKSPKWLDPANIKFFQHGRGNNWTYGYLHQIPQNVLHDCTTKHRQFSHQLPNKSLISLYLRQNKEICEYVLDRSRKQLETIDCAMCINVLCSLGGGTGSGLGTKIIQLISDQFSIDLHTHVILPNKSGQTPLQVYNCALSLSEIQQNSSCIFTYQNDLMIQMYTNEQNGDLNNINKNIADNISNLISINDLKNYNRFYNHIVDQCIIGKNMNYLYLFGNKNKNWNDSFDNIFNNLKLFNANDQFTSQKQRGKCLSNNMLLIGKQKCQYQIKYKKRLKNLLNSQQSIRYDQTIPNKGQNQQKQISLIINHSNILRYLNYILESGRKKYQAKAYLWHYQYADLENAFQKINYVVDQYQFNSL